jgi:predicted site-specific integrase-resolvase
MSDLLDRMLPTRMICARYGICARTVSRWLEAGILPQPLRVNGVRYWRQREIEQREASLSREGSARPRRAADRKDT